MTGDEAHRRRHTWAEYRTWDTDERYELVGGEAFLAAAAPSMRHQWVVGRLWSALERHFSGRAWIPFSGPADIVISDEDVVQPDLFVICDRGQIKETHVEGPPALVIEVISPSTAVHDRMRKADLYARAGVQELWLVTPHPPLVEMMVLQGKRYVHERTLDQSGTLTSVAFPDLRIDLADVFSFPIEPNDGVQLVKEVEVPFG